MAENGKSLPARKDKIMRSILAVVLCFALLFSTSMAQVGPQAPAARNASPIAEVQKPIPFIALYECDLDQCEKGGGGAVWLFDGNRGQAMWRYNAIADLTVVQFDGVNIHIHRADPVGSYSSDYAPGHGQFTGDYFGKITGSNTLEGYSYWNGDNRKEKLATWRATIVNHAFCSDLAPKPCPLRPDQLSILGRRASEAKMFPAAFRCFQLAAEMGDPDGKGFEATMMMNGWGGKHSPQEIMGLLQESANQKSYPGEKGLAQAYQDGVIVAKNPQQAAYWNNKANARQAELQAQQSLDTQGGRVMSTLAAVAILVAIMGAGSSPSSGYYSDDEARRRMYAEMYAGKAREMDDEQHQAERDANVPSW